MTLKEWNKFHTILKDSEGNFVPPGNDFQYRNYFTGKVESLQTVTAQEVLLTKYKIIIEEFEPKWTRRYHKITKVVNMKNFDKGMKTFDKSMQSFSKGMGETEKIHRQNKKNLEIINGKSKKSTAKTIGKIVWGITKDTAAQFTEDQTKKKKIQKSPNQCTWGTKTKTKSRNSLKIWSDENDRSFF